jgi:copper chaperone CopZ
MSQTTQTEIAVSGMTCGHCTAAVSQELSALPGVVAVAIDLHPGEDSPVTITSEAPLDPAVLADAVAEAGYSVR